MENSLLHMGMAASARGNIQLSSPVVVITIALDNKRSFRIRNYSSHTLNRFVIGGLDGYKHNKWWRILVEDSLHHTSVVASAIENMQMGFSGGSEHYCL